MSRDESIKIFEEELDKVTNMLNFLINQPQFATSLTNIEKDRVMAINLIRVKCCKIWSENMLKELKLKTSKEVVSEIESAFKLVEVSGK